MPAAPCQKIGKPEQCTILLLMLGDPPLQPVVCCIGHPDPSGDVLPMKDAINQLPVILKSRNVCFSP